jgi:hypothetical protein
MSAIQIDSMTIASTDTLSIARRLIGDEQRLMRAVEAVTPDWDRADLLQQMDAADLAKNIVPFKSKTVNDRTVASWRTYEVVCAIAAHLAQMNGAPFDGGAAAIESAGAPALAALLW